MVDSEYFLGKVAKVIAITYLGEVAIVITFFKVANPTLPHTPM